MCMQEREREREGERDLVGVVFCGLNQIIDERVR